MGNRLLLWLFIVLLITVIASCVILYVLVCADCGVSWPAPKHIDVECKKEPSEAWDCTILAAEDGVNFTRVGAYVLRPNGEIIGTWSPPVEFNASGGKSVSESLSPLSADSAIRDDGDRRLSANDTFHLVPVQGRDLVGFHLSLSGGGASGTATLE